VTGDWFVKGSVCQKNRAATINFINSEHLLLLFLVGIDLIQFPIDYGKSSQIGLEPAAQFP